MSETDLRVSKIKDGTVIDHIREGYALDVIKILGITGIVKIEGRALNPQEVNRIALVAPHASINIVQNYKVVKKVEVKLPNAIEGIIKCVNPCCISNSDEPIFSKFYVKSEEPLLLKCHYCGFTLEQLDVLRQL